VENLAGLGVGRHAICRVEAVCLHAAASMSAISKIRQSEKIVASHGDSMI